MKESMESLGAYLKTERESRNLTLKEVSESTKIREHLLRAIENDQYELISSPVYVKGFLDAYARYLGLPPNDIIVRYQEYLEGMLLSKQTEVERRKTSAKKGGRLRRFFILAMILILGVLVFYLSYKPFYHSLSSFEKREPAINPLPSQPSPPPDQKEENPQTTDVPERSQNQ